MAKASKKKVTATPKKSKKKTATKPIPETAPPVDPESVNICFSTEDLSIFANLLSITAQTYQNLAAQAAHAKEGDLYAILLARQKLSTQLANRLISHLRIGEPESRGVH